MITEERACEIISACDEIVKSPAFNDKGKEQAKLKRSEMIKELRIFGTFQRGS